VALQTHWTFPVARRLWRGYSPHVVSTVRNAEALLRTGSGFDTTRCHWRLYVGALGTADFGSAPQCSDGQ